MLRNQWNKVSRKIEYNLSFFQKGQKCKRLFFVRLRVSWFDKKRFIYSLSNGGPQSEKEKKWIMF